MLRCLLCLFPFRNQTGELIGGINTTTVHRRRCSSRVVVAVVGGGFWVRLRLSSHPEVGKNLER